MEEDAAQVFGGGDAVAQAGVPQLTGAEKDGGDYTQHNHHRGKADDAPVAAAHGALFATRVEQHDSEDEQHHDGTGIDDDLRSGQKLCAQQQVEDGQRGHHHNQRQGAVDGMALEQEVDGPSQAESGK